ncbi:MAG: hypothetical protein HFG35_00275 [Eubacterium sp.]|nr:hypothetical protein [Eubacterium sp.]
MSMKINGNYNDSRTNYAEQLKAEQSLDRAERAEETKKVQNDPNASDKITVPCDEYTSSKKAGEKPSGLYQLGQDENGNRKVFFDDPKKSEEKCVGNTDKVDREIQKLKEKQQQLEQQIRSATNDEQKVRELEKKLAQVEGELRQKDNDTYRRQNSEFFIFR